MTYLSYVSDTSVEAAIETEEMIIDAVAASQYGLNEPALSNAPQRIKPR